MSLSGISDGFGRIGKPNFGSCKRDCEIRLTSRDNQTINNRIVGYDRGHTEIRFSPRKILPHPFNSSRIDLPISWLPTVI